MFSIYDEKLCLCFSLSKELNYILRDFLFLFLFPSLVKWEKSVRHSKGRPVFSWLTLKIFFVLLVVVTLLAVVSLLETKD